MDLGKGFESIDQFILVNKGFSHWKSSSVQIGKPEASRVRSFMGSGEDRRSATKGDRLMVLEGTLLNLKTKCDQMLEKTSYRERLLEELLRIRGGGEDRSPAVAPLPHPPPPQNPIPVQYMPTVPSSSLDLHHIPNPNFQPLGTNLVNPSLTAMDFSLQCQSPDPLVSNPYQSLYVSPLGSIPRTQQDHHYYFDSNPNSSSNSVQNPGNNIGYSCHHPSTHPCLGSFPAQFTPELHPHVYTSPVHQQSGNQNVQISYASSWYPLIVATTPQTPQATGYVYSNQQQQGCYGQQFVYGSEGPSSNATWQYPYSGGYNVQTSPYGTPTTEAIETGRNPPTHELFNSCFVHSRSASVEWKRENDIAEAISSEEEIPNFTNPATSGKGYKEGATTDTTEVEDSNFHKPRKEINVVISDNSGDDEEEEVEISVEQRSEFTSRPKAIEQSNKKKYIDTESQILDDGVQLANVVHALQSPLVQVTLQIIPNSQELPKETGKEISMDYGFREVKDPSNLLKHEFLPLDFASKVQPLLAKITKPGVKLSSASSVPETFKVYQSRKTDMLSKMISLFDLAFVEKVSVDAVRCLIHPPKRRYKHRDCLEELMITIWDPGSVTHRRGCNCHMDFRGELQKAWDLVSALEIQATCRIRDPGSIKLFQFKSTDPWGSKMVVSSKDREKDVPNPGGSQGVSEHCHAISTTPGYLKTRMDALDKFPLEDKFIEVLQGKWNHGSVQQWLKANLEKLLETWKFFAELSSTSEDQLQKLFKFYEMQIEGLQHPMKIWDPGIKLLVH